MPYMLVINCDNKEAEKKSLDVLNKTIKKYKIKSKTVTKINTELMIEIRLHDIDSEFVDKIVKIDHVNSAVLVSYNGEYTG